MPADPRPPGCRLVLRAEVANERLGARLLCAASDVKLPFRVAKKAGPLEDFEQDADSFPFREDAEVSQPDTPPRLGFWRVVAVWRPAMSVPDFFVRIMRGRARLLDGRGDTHQPIKPAPRRPLHEQSSLRGDVAGSGMIVERSQNRPAGDGAKERAQIPVPRR